MSYKFKSDGSEEDLTMKQRVLYVAFLNAGYPAKIKKGLYCVDGKYHDCRLIVIGNSIASSFHPDGYPVKNVYDDCPVEE